MKEYCYEINNKEIKLIKKQYTDKDDFLYKIVESIDSTILSKFFTGYKFPHFYDYYSNYDINKDLLDLIKKITVDVESKNLDSKDFINFVFFTINEFNLKNFSIIGDLQFILNELSEKISLEKKCIKNIITFSKLVKLKFSVKISADNFSIKKVSISFFIKKNEVDKFFEIMKFENIEIIDVDILKKVIVLFDERIIEEDESKANNGYRLVFGYDYINDEMKTVGINSVYIE